MSKIVSIASCKGGVGKSTAVLNIGTALSRQGKRVLVIDNDAQSSLTRFLLGEHKADINLSDLIKEIMDNTKEENIKALVKDSIIKLKYLDLISTDIRMAGLELGMAMVTNREYVMKEILKDIKIEYDYILIDNAPSLGIFVVNALTASDSVIIPVETHYAALEVFDLIINSVKIVKRRLNPELKIEGVIMTKHQEVTTMCRTIKNLIKSECAESIRLFETPIPYSIKIAESPAFGMSIFEYDRKNPAADVYEKIAGGVIANE